MPKSQEDMLPLPDRIDYEPEGMRVQTLHSAACALFAAINYIFSTEDDVVTAEQVANVVGFSRYHLSRMFQSFFQEAPRDLIVRTRVERAALRLLGTRASINSIASDEGYANAESFSRAFRTEYGMTPRDFRKLRPEWRLPCPSVLHWHENLERLPLLDGGAVEVEVVLMPKQRLATYRHVGPYDQTSDGWSRLETLLPGRPWERPGVRLMSVYHDDWLRRQGSSQRSDLGFTVPHDVRLPAGVSELWLPRGLYVATRRPLARKENPDVWSQLTGRWLPRRGTRPVNIPAIAEHEGWPLSGEDGPRRLYLGLDVQIAPPWEV
jgi:AraC family transcriptional regulator